MVTAEGKVTSGRTNDLTTGSLDVAQALVFPEALVRLRELLDSRPFTLRASSGPAFEAPGVHDGTLWESLEVASSRRGAKMSALPSPP